jgi:hypothetical protein
MDVFTSQSGNLCKGLPPKLTYNIFKPFQLPPQKAWGELQLWKVSKKLCKKIGAYK